MEISIILPVYNVAPYIEACVRSIIDQTFTSWELIVVDDASPDQSIPCLKAVMDSVSGVRWILVSHEINRGLAAARNSGLEKASGKYVFFADSDDYLDRDLLESLHASIQASGADIVVSGLKTFEASEPGRFQEELPPKERLVSGKEALYSLLMGHSRSYICTQLFRRALFEHISFPEGYVYEDRLTAPYLFQAAAAVQFVRRAGYNYRQRKGSITKSFQPGMIKNVARISRLVSDLQSFLPETGGRKALNTFLYQNLYSIVLLAMIHGDNYQTVFPIWKEVRRHLHMTDIWTNMKSQHKPMIAMMVFKLSPGLFWSLARGYYTKMHGL